MADDFQLIIKQMKKEREDKIAADKKAEAKQVINNDKALKAFNDQSKKDKETLKKLQEDLFRELNDTNKEAIKEQIENLKEDRRIKDEMEKARLEDIADRKKEKAEIKDLRSKEKKELDERKAAFEKFKESIVAKGEDPEKNAQVRDEGIKLRKQEFDLRVKNLEGTDLMAARLEELGNDLKDKGLDPEKNTEFQKESLKLQKAELRERLRNAETKSERREILKDQAAKDKRALSFSQKQQVLLTKIGDKFSDLIPSQESVATGIFGFLKKAALIGLLLFLPKILNSDTAKDLVKKIEDNLPTIKDGLLKIGKFFVDTAIAIGNVALIIADLFTGNFRSAFDRLSTSVTDAFSDDPENKNSLVGKLTLIVGALGLFKFAKLLLNIRTIGGIIAGMVGLSNKTIADSGGGGGGGQDTGKKLSKKNLAKEGLKLNKAGKIVDAKTGKFVSQQRIAQAGFKLPVAGDKMKQLSKIGKIGKFLKRIPVLGYILSLGSVAATLMRKDLSGTEKAKKVGGELGGLAGAGVGALALSFIPFIGTLVGGMAGYFGGKYLFTKLFEFLLGDSSDKELTEDLTPPSEASSGANGGDMTMSGQGTSPTTSSFTGTVSGEQSLALSRAMKSGNQAEIDRIMSEIKSGGTSSPLKPDASNMFPAENPIITNVDNSVRSQQSTTVMNSETTVPLDSTTLSIANAGA